LNIEERETWAAVVGGFGCLIFGVDGAKPDFGGHVSREVTLCLEPVLLQLFRSDTGVKFSSIDA
jgi:hypothetical protein